MGQRWGFISFLTYFTFLWGISAAPLGHKAIPSTWPSRATVCLADEWRTLKFFLAQSQALPYFSTAFPIPLTCPSQTYLSLQLVFTDWPRMEEEKKTGNTYWSVRKVVSLGSLRLGAPLTGFRGQNSQPVPPSPFPTHLSPLPKAGTYRCFFLPPQRSFLP